MEQLLQLLAVGEGFGLIHNCRQALLYNNDLYTVRFWEDASNHNTDSSDYWYIAGNVSGYTPKVKTWFWSRDVAPRPYPHNLKWTFGHGK